MGHGAPMLANFEALPEILTAQELEKFLRINRKTIYSYVERGLIRTCGSNRMSASRNTRFSAGSKNAASSPAR
jgi:hypothetical protein